MLSRVRKTKTALPRRVERPEPPTPRPASPNVPTEEGRSDPTPHPPLVARVPLAGPSLEVAFPLLGDAPPDQRRGRRNEEGRPRGVGEAGDAALEPRERQIPGAAREAKRPVRDEDLGGLVEPEGDAGPAHGAREPRREKHPTAEERQARRQPAEICEWRGCRGTGVPPGLSRSSLALSPGPGVTPVRSRDVSRELP